MENREQEVHELGLAVEKKRAELEERLQNASEQAIQVQEHADDIDSKQVKLEAWDARV